MHLPCPSLGSAPPPAPQASQTYQVDLGLTLNASTQLIVCVDCTHHFSGLDYLTCVALILFFFSFCLCSSRPIEQRRQWHPTPVLLPGKSHGWRSLVGCSHGVAKSRTRLSNFKLGVSGWPPELISKLSDLDQSVFTSLSPRVLM